MVKVFTHTQKLGIQRITERERETVTHGEKTDSETEREIVRQRERESERNKSTYRGA